VLHFNDQLVLNWSCLFAIAVVDKKTCLLYQLSAQQYYYTWALFS
jgi:hypothetical protein